MAAAAAPQPSADHSAHAKRALAEDLVRAMASLGFTRFAVTGHDRGARVVYRMALDHAETVSRLAVMDIVPTEAAWSRAEDRFALAYWPWSLLAQPAPLPERILESAASAVVDNALDEWGSSTDAFPDDIRAAYVDALRDSHHAKSICEEYRAAASMDRMHDAEDLAS
jgi:haloacetate dehalogenase